MEMIKVFLVEDEVIIRNGVKNNIPWEQEGFLFAGEASDGELAWPLIRKTQPDILITDIRMPFMDGLELASLVRKELPDTKIIILSGYSEFDYAKQAINLGVANYLLKPINSEKLLEAVKQVGNTIREEREHLALVEQYRQDNQEIIVLEKKQLFNSIVAGAASPKELLEKGRELGMDLTAAYYTVLLLKLIGSGEGPEYSGEMVETSRRLNEIVSKSGRALSFDRGLEGWALLLKAESEEEAKAQLKNLETSLRGILTEHPDIHYFGGIGETVQRMRDIRASYQSASKAFASRFFVNKDQFFHAAKIDQISLQTNRDMSLKSVDPSKINRRLMEDFLRSGVDEETDDFVEEYFRSIGEENYRSVMFCHYLIVDMNFCACQVLESMGIDPNLLPVQCRDVDQFSSYMNSTQGMREYAAQLFHETICLRDNSSRNKYQELIETAKKYIAENFQYNEFSLNQAAAMVGLSPGYFSTLFRQETDMTFVEYLTYIRLEKAKALLMCTNLRSSEIGYEVGYRDSHYFSYIFKKVCGCTPKEYRTGKRE